jgi:hypothetical protein
MRRLCLMDRGNAQGTFAEIQMLTKMALGALTSKGRGKPAMCLSAHRKLVCFCDKN